MQPEEQATHSASPERFLPRQVEMTALAELIPIRGVETRSKRVFNVWGEPSVGKSTFISEFRESEHMTSSKVLWIQPTRDSDVDTIEEFIRACSKSVRYPADPSKEEKIAKNLEIVERGKINPVVSDDSLLIIRSSVAANRKPYINQAAAASVGRTEVEREDIQISVGLGESKANNQAEGFLDALPLQALGTDLIILYLERLERLSVTVLDWLRDYVIPSATRGAYRRSLVILTETLDPARFQFPAITWGEWDELSTEYRLRRMSEDDVYQLCLNSGVSKEHARYIYFKTSGYPREISRYIHEAKCGSFDGPTANVANALLQQLAPEDKLKLGALCLPNQLYPDELDALFGPSAGKAALEWISKLPDSPLQRDEESKSFRLPDPFRASALAAIAHRPEFQVYRNRWQPLARLTHNLPVKSTRSKMLLLAGLYWLDDDVCRNLFGEQAERIIAFVAENEGSFYRQGDRYRASDRFRAELEQVAQQMEHIGTGAIRRKARELWQGRRAAILARIQELESTLETRQKEVNALAKKQSENAAQIRIHERKSGSSGYTSATARIASQKSHGSLVILLSILSICCFVAATQLGSPYNFVTLIAGLASISIGLAYVPSWVAHRKAVALASASQVRNSPEFMRRQSLELSHEQQSIEDKIDAIRHQIETQQDQLRHPIALEVAEQ